jgi:hypothetical protein
MSANLLGSVTAGLLSAIALFHLFRLAGETSQLVIQRSKDS